jgi:hypothetical protein
MALVKGTVEAVSTKYDKYSILVNDQWYGTKMEWARVKPNKGDSVEFDDGGSKFLKKVKILGSSGGSSPAPKGGYNQVGVEVGHATNIATQVMGQWVQQQGTESPEVGSKAYWAKFCEVTDTVHDITEAFRTKYSAPKPGSEAKEAKATAKAIDEPSEDEDLF